MGEDGNIDIHEERNKRLRYIGVVTNLWEGF